MLCPLFIRWENFVRRVRRMIPYDVSWIRRVFYSVWKLGHRYVVWIYHIGRFSKRYSELALFHTCFFFFLFRYIDLPNCNPLYFLIKIELYGMNTMLLIMVAKISLLFPCNKNHCHLNTKLLLQNVIWSRITILSNIVETNTQKYIYEH